jgi:hypothetical protein
MNCAFSSCELNPKILAQSVSMLRADVRAMALDAFSAVRHRQVGIGAVEWRL